MKDKQPQTCYVPTRELTNITLVDRTLPFNVCAAKIPDCYIFTKEELEERDRKLMREAAEKAMNRAMSILHTFGDFQQIDVIPYLDKIYPSPNKKIEDDKSNTGN